MSSVLFSLFAALTLGAAAAAVLSRNAVNAAMCLLLCLAGVAGLFVHLDAFLLAFLLILVYAGAVVALFLFIIMLLDVRGQPLPGPGIRRGSSLVLAAIVIAGWISFAARGAPSLPPPGPSQAIGASLKLYAERLFTAYLLPVQVVGFLLLIAMLGAIALSRRQPPAP